MHELYYKYYVETQLKFVFFGLNQRIMALATQVNVETMIIHCHFFKWLKQVSVVNIFFYGNKYN